MAPALFMPCVLPLGHEFVIMHACIHIIIWLPSAASTSSGNSFGRDLVSLLYYRQCLDEGTAHGKYSASICWVNEGSPDLKRSVLPSGITDGKGSFLAPSEEHHRQPSVLLRMPLAYALAAIPPASKLLGRTTLVWVQHTNSREVDLMQVFLPPINRICSEQLVLLGGNSHSLPLISKKQLAETK